MACWGHFVPRAPKARSMELRKAEPKVLSYDFRIRENWLLNFRAKGMLNYQGQSGLGYSAAVLWRVIYLLSKLNNTQPDQLTWQGKKPVCETWGSLLVITTGEKKKIEAIHFLTESIHLCTRLVRLTDGYKRYAHVSSRNSCNLEWWCFLKIVEAK